MPRPPATSQVFPRREVRSTSTPRRQIRSRFTPEARARAQENLNRRSIDDPTGHCIFAASPRITGVGLFPIQFVQTPTQVVIMYEYLSTIRVIPMGAKHPEDMSPSYMGDSIGHWEGDYVRRRCRWIQAGRVADRRAGHQRCAALDRTLYARRSRSAELRSDH